MEDFVPTRASQNKRTAINNYVSVNYEAPKKKPRQMNNLNDEKQLQKDDSANPTEKQSTAELKKQQEKEMKKARYDVIKFGMSGFEKAKARKAKVELAISLGAVPPKNRRMNYKLLKVRRKMEKEKKKEEIHVSGFTSSLLRPKSKRAHKKNSGILGIYGKVSKNALPKQKS